MSCEGQTIGKKITGLPEILRGKSGTSKVVILLLIVSIIAMVSVGVYALSMDHALYIDGNKIAVVEDKEACEQIIADYVSLKQEQIGGIVDFSNNIEFVRGDYDDAETRMSSEEVLAKVKDQCELTAKGAIIVVNGVESIAVTSPKIANDLLAQFKEEFSVPLKSDATVIEGWLSEKIQVVEKEVPFADLVSKGQAYKYLANGSFTPVAYVAKVGDTFESVAENYGLTVEQLNKLNPAIEESENLSEGQYVIVKEIKPIIHYIVKCKYHEEIGIAPEVEYIDDAAMVDGTFKVLNEGQIGMKTCYISAVQQNGVITNTEIIAEKMKYEPIKKTVVRGTMVIEGLSSRSGSYRGSARGTGTIDWPVSGTITSKFGPRSRGYHTGLDIAAPIGTSIKACDTGEIIRTEYAGGYGNLIVVAHGNGIETWYAHLSSIDVRVGDVVVQGQHIGKMGSTGNSTGSHLHLEVRVNGTCYDPLNYL